MAGQYCLNHHIINKPGFDKEYSCDNTRLMKELGDFQFTPIEEAIKELSQYYKENLDKIDKSAIQ